MVDLLRAFRQIKSQPVIVIGDLMLDTYTIGKAKRISPEAPVPVLQVQSEEHRPGGAGNVALNLVSMGADVKMVGRIGSDKSGALLLESLAKEGIHTEGIWSQTDYCTPVKNRVIADHQQMVRVDYETLSPLPEIIEQQVIERLPQLLDSVKVVAISDYGKGMITSTLAAALIEACQMRAIPVIVDPKGIDFTKYCNATIVKPNEAELYAAANLSPDAPLDLAAKKVLDTTNAEVLMVTRSEEGISLFYQTGNREDYPVKVCEVIDVTGAGDTVLGILALSIANRLSMIDAARLSNAAAGIAVTHFGCARVTLSDLARKLLSENTDNKMFDEQHLYALQEALKGRKFVILAVSVSNGVLIPLFDAIHTLAKKNEWELVVYVEDDNPDPSLIRVIASLHDVDYIIVQSQGLRHISKLLQPTAVYNLELNRIAGLS